VRVFRREDIIRHPPPARMSPHDPGLKESIQLVELEQGRELAISLVGVVVARTDHGTGLSPEVIAALPAAVDAVIAELKDLGVEPTTQDATGPLRPWWT
jgi:hydrogenase maturation protease